MKRSFYKILSIAAILCFSSAVSAMATDKVCEYGVGNVCKGPIFVASMSDVNSAKQTVSKEIQTFQTQYRQDMQHMEDRLNSNVVNSVNQIPQRLLSEEAKQEIEESMKVYLGEQLGQLRSQLQQQIDELKSHHGT